ncbi:MAG: ABC transporter ATP-binding protein [Halanaerobiales bacterium]
MPDNIIDVKNLIKVYGEEVENEVLHSLSFQIEKGDFVSIIGPSGSGKSTLLNILGALDTPTKGEVWINGEEIGGLSAKKLAEFRNRNMGFVFQFHHLLPEFTALENILIPDWIKGGKRKNLERARELLSLVGLADFEDKLITKLSGGQKQRVAMARALMNKPEIVFADEPTGNLDSETTEKIYDLLRDINQELNTTFILVTHDRHLAGRADRVIQIVDGDIKRDIMTDGEGEENNWDELAPSYCKCP